VKYVNLTPHAVTVMDKDGATILSVPPSGTVARLSETAQPAPVWREGVRADRVEDGVPYTLVILGEVSGLPEPQDGVIYIGSMPLLMGMMAAQIQRSDVVYPYGQVRDSEGRIIGCRSLATLA